MADDQQQTNYVNGIQMRRGDVAKLTFPSPGSTLVKRLMEELAAIPIFSSLFGRMVAFDSAVNQRWACYPKWDWSLRQLPAIMIFEGDPEQKSSENAWLDGSLRMIVCWPGGQRRADWEQIPVHFKGAIQNFFASKYTYALLDPVSGVNAESKVPGLNALGREITWSPNVDGIVAGEAVPLTIIDIKYRIDLRKWYDALEDAGRTKSEPFADTVFPWTELQGKIELQAEGCPTDAAAPFGCDMRGPPPCPEEE